MTTMTPETSRPAGNLEKPSAGDVRHSCWGLLRYRGFRWYFIGSLVSNLGTWLQNTVQVLLAYQLMHSVFYVGVVVSAQFAGTLLLSPWAAVLADRLGHKKVLVGTQSLSAGIAFAMTYRHHHHLLGVHTLIVGALGLGIMFALALPVQTALVPTLVAPKDTKAAMAMNSVSYNSGRALAPALCVLVFAFVGPGLVFTLNAVSFLIFASILSRLKLAPVHGASLMGPDYRADHSRPRTRLMDGVRTARRHRRILLLLAIVAAVTFADDPIQVLSPGLAHNLHLPGDWAAYFIAALGWGTVLGSVPPYVRYKLRDAAHASRRAAWSLLALALAVIIFAQGLSAPLTLLAAFVAGGAALFTGAAASSLIVGRRQAAASVAGLWAIAWAGTKPIASFLDGWLASNVGIRLTGVFLASPAIILALGEICIPASIKKRIKAWSLTKYVEIMKPFYSMQVRLYSMYLASLLSSLDDFIGPVCRRAALLSGEAAEAQVCQESDLATGVTGSPGEDPTSA